MAGPAGAMGADGPGAAPGAPAADISGELAGFYRLIDSAIGACEEFREAVLRVEESLTRLRSARPPGPPPAVLGGDALRDAWSAYAEALLSMNRAVTHARAEGYRAAVDDGGVGLTELARLSGHSRQQVTRLVNRGRAAREDI
ncbi:hypothetical protein [Streptomyces sp. NPDC058953]